jgi:metal-sulfur cluster biosynthetic enzyme
MTPAEAVTERIWSALRSVDDPELGINIVDLGLVYAVLLEPGRVAIRLTMTSPACPLGPFIVDQARAAIESFVPEAGEVDIELVWEPPWHPGLMAEHVAGAFGPGR